MGEQDKIIDTTRSAKEWRWAVWLLCGSIAMFVLLNAVSAWFQIRDESGCKHMRFDHAFRIGVGDRVCIALGAVPQPVSASSPGTAVVAQATSDPAKSGVWTLKMDGTIVATSREFTDADPSQAFVNFKLNKDDDAASEDAIAQRRIWGGQAPNLVTGLIERRVTIESDGRAVALPNAKLRVFFPSLIVIGGLLLVMFVAGTVFACRSSGVIRDPANGTYSLARTQMMFWFVLVTFCFVFIYMSTGQMRGVLTPSTLALVGIYSVTSLFAASPVPAGGAAQPVPGSFFGQLISGGTSGDLKDVTGERLITIIWSIILGAILLNAVVSKFAFPEFDASSLTLAGLSSGSFAGFKKLGK